MPRAARSVVVTGAIAALTLVATALARAQAPDRRQPPQPGPPPALNLPAVEKRQLTNGLSVWTVALHQVPVVQVTLVVFRGTADDPAGKFGLASMTAAMLTEGAGTRTGLEIADAADFLGANLTAASGFDSTVVRLHLPVRHLAEALPIMADVALRPTFPPDELERVRRERLTNLLQARADPATIAAAAFARVLYGPNHRFGVPTFGTAATLQRFTPDDVRTFYRSVFRPENAALLLVGDITSAEALPLLESAFGGWKATGPPAPAAVLPATEEPAARQVYLVDKPGAAQSQIRIGGIGVARSTPDYFVLQVTNTILGGSFGSRLNMNLREKHGYTYGAGSGFEMRRAAGPFAAAAGVQTDKTGDALKEFFNELNGIRQPVPADELAREKHYVSLRFPAGFETTGDISRRLEDVLVYRLPQDYFSHYVQNIEAVTAAQVQRAAEKYIQPDRFAVVVVGDLKTIEPAIRALDLGPVKTLSIDDVFGPAPATAP